MPARNMDSAHTECGRYPHVRLFRIVSDAGHMPMRTCCKWLIYMDRTGLGRTALPVCGQHRTAGAHCQQTSRCRSPPPASARAELVNRAQDDFLASPGLARHQTVALVDATACTSARMERRPPRCPAMVSRKGICVRSDLRAISLSIRQRAVVLIRQRVQQNLTVRSYFTPPFAVTNRANKRPGLGRSQLIPAVLRPSHALIPELPQS